MRVIRSLLYILISITAGVVFFAIHHEWILFRFPTTSSATSLPHTATKRTIVITYWKGDTCVREHREIMWSNSILQQLTRIIATYWSILETEGLLTHPTTVQTVTIDQHATTIICSLSHNPFDTAASAHHVWHIVEGLLSTIHIAFPQFHHIILLVNQERPQHECLDLSQPWPLIGFLDTKISTATQIQSRHISHEQSPIVVIHPAGDTSHTGKTIGDAFERTITLEMAHALQHAIAQHTTAIRVLITRSPGEHHEALDAARFANRVGATLYISLHMYYIPQTTPEMYLYTFRLHPTTDTWTRHNHTQVLVPYYQAHLQSCMTSTHYARTLYEFVQKHSFAAVTPYYAAFPYAPLVGVQTPAIGIEIGLHDPHDVKQLSTPLAQAIVSILSQ